MSEISLDAYPRYSDVPEFEVRVGEIRDKLMSLVQILKNGGNGGDVINVLRDELEVLSVDAEGDVRRELIVSKLKNGVDECEKLEESVEVGMEEEMVEEERVEDINKFQIVHKLINNEEVERQEMIAAEREIEINKIKESVFEINEIFKDIDKIVINQSEIIGNIENNIFNSLDNSRLASIELVRADKWDKRRNKCSCILMIIIIVIFMILLVLII